MTDLRTVDEDPFVRLADYVSGKPEPERPPVSAVAQQLASMIQLGATHSPRSRQTVVGASEVGQLCDRRLTYKLGGTEPVNWSDDPLRPLIGTGVHLALDDVFARLDDGAGRYLMRHRIMYRDVPGEIDLYDRWLRLLVDWKTSTKAKIARYAKGEVTAEYLVQAQIYAAGLIEQGKPVDAIAICYVPLDGALRDMWATELTPDRAMADAAIDRLEVLRGLAPVNATPTPTHTCGWCPQYQPTATDLALACPGSTRGTVS